MCVNEFISSDDNNKIIIIVFIGNLHHFIIYNIIIIFICLLQWSVNFVCECSCASTEHLITYKHTHAGVRFVCVSTEHYSNVYATDMDCSCRHHGQWDEMVKLWFHM